MAWRSVIVVLPMIARLRVVAPPFPLISSTLERFQIFDEIALLLVAQLEAEVIVVVAHHVLQGGEAAVVVEAALVDLLRVPEGAQRRRPVAAVRRALGLEIVNAD